jgi:hypothetical protein
MDILYVGTWTTWYQLTTPIAYLTTVPASPFKYKEYVNLRYNDIGLPAFDYAQYDHVMTYRGDTAMSAQALQCQAQGVFYVVTCAGPDQDLDMVWSNAPGFGTRSAAAFAMLYDPTNGTVSSGDIIMLSNGFPN